MDPEYDKNGIYQGEKISLEETKEKLEWSKCAFECEQKIHMGFKKIIWYIYMKNK